MADEQQKPQAKFNIGKISATVWRNDNGSHRTEIVRNYQDKEGNWKSSSNFTQAELLSVSKLSDRAEEWIARQRAVADIKERGQEGRTRDVAGDRGR